jgi:hypothetical protein
MKRKNQHYDPPFTDSENFLQSLADKCFLMWSLLSLLPFLGWIWMPNRLAIEWNEAGQAIDWINKPMALAYVLCIIVSGGIPWHFILRVSATHPSIIRYPGPINSSLRVKKYQLGREGAHVILIETWIFLIIKSIFDFQSYFSGSINLLKSSGYTALFIVITITAIIYAIKQIDRII